MSLISKNVLVTGATGFIGYHLTKKLLEQNCNVIAVGRNFKLLNRLPKNKLLIKVSGDLAKDDFLINLFLNYKIDVIFHLAAKVHDRLEKDVKQHRLINVNLTEKLSELALKNNVEKLLFFSTVSVYGDTEERTIDETEIHTPSTTYGKTKLEAENILIKAYQKYNLPIIILRLTSVYGTYDHGNLQLLAKLIRKHLSAMVGKGKNRKTMIYIDDVIQAVILAAIRDEAVGEVFNIGENSYTFCEILDTLEKMLDVSTLRFKIPLSLGKVIEKQNINITLSKLIKTIGSDNCYSSDKAKKILGFKPIFNLEQGLKESVDWYRSS
ncbi:dTDP-glucose 4,6-dehydratase [subsurface metagenome]|jgi:nucleoside-diphosphate-sugar epimerase